MRLSGSTSGSRNGAGRSRGIGGTGRFLFPGIIKDFRKGQEVMN